MSSQLQFKQALLSDGWASGVEIEISNEGVISEIRKNVHGEHRGVAIPGMANVHSHAHQRAMAGFAERSGVGPDSFWTWRSTMYHFMQTMQPHQLSAIAAQLFLEMLNSGFTRVAEFQYLHHQASGQPYDDRAEMSLQLLQAADLTGIGMTCLPVHYQFSGFGEQQIAQTQRRFFNTPDEFLRLIESLVAPVKENPNHSLGIAAHSLRASSVTTFNTILQALEGSAMPIHMHIAEQKKEVEDCLAWSGLRPVQYGMENFAIDEHWCLIHATHMSEQETHDLAKSGAVAGLCPTTEANLGDGFFNAENFLKVGGRFGIGSDSHCSVSPVEELRWLEYGQRLLHGTRNHLAGGTERSTGRSLFELATVGGNQACGHSAGTLEVGKRADIVVLDESNPLLIERTDDAILDSWIFSGNVNAVRDVYVGGQRVIQNGQHPKQEIINQNFRAAMRELTV